MTPYELLGLGADATEAQVRRAYRRLARRWHPDLNPGNADAARRYAAITEAFELLVDPARRRAYDASGAAAPSVAAPPAFAGFDFSLAMHGADASTFGDLFVDVFRQAAGHHDGRPVRGVDLHTEITLTLEDVLRGGNRRLELSRRIACRLCRGHGRLDAPAAPCRACAGSGQQRLGRGHMVFVRPCEPCQGRGVVTARTCHGCHGHGQHEATTAVDVVVPPGLDDGDELVQAGAGHAGVRGGAPGDLRIRVRVAPDARVRRVGDDLHMTLPVAVHEAVLGARVPVPTPDGPVTVRVPAGIQSGQRLRLRERGVPSRRTGARGDLVLDVVLVLPPVIDARARGLMQEFARLHPEDVRAGWYGDQGDTRGDDADVAPEQSAVAGRPTQAE
ncbi:chaperone protein DnaJ [Luteitalea sp. TBR-22]|uniref:DnaJ C-terminal domain-containing protein n=1 Tax=Luteitalea sp. TBR-22 TaxID=2802971 RepID=UPI001AFA9123|nr:J domain-containing protein [Luteitalea sp. TBR-22]BCS34163.1 chaperone protein DnaJ [Luteitalea sp. TBR-22]